VTGPPFSVAEMRVNAPGKLRTGSHSSFRTQYDPEAAWSSSSRKTECFGAVRDRLSDKQMGRAPHLCSISLQDLSTPVNLKKFSPVNVRN
jgi:hypothetical protein